MSEVKHTPLQRVAHYVRMREEKPLRQVDDHLHGVHVGTEWEAILTLSDLRSVVNSHGDLVEALRRICDPTFAERWQEAYMTNPPRGMAVTKMQEIAKEALSKVLELGEGL